MVLDPDATDYTSQAYTDLSKQLIKDRVDRKFHPYRYLRALGHDGISSNKVIIWNQAFTNLDGFQKTVINMQSFAQQNAKKLLILVVEVEVNPDVAKARISKRSAKGGHNVPDQEFQRFLHDYRSFEDEGFNTVHVNGTDEVGNSVSKIMQSLALLGV